MWSGCARQRGSCRRSSSNNRRNSSSKCSRGSSISIRGAKKKDRPSSCLKVCPNQHHRRRNSPVSRKKICRCTAL